MADKNNVLEEFLSSGKYRIVVWALQLTLVVVASYQFYVTTSKIENRQRVTSDEIKRRIEDLKVASLVDPHEQLRQELLKIPFNRQYLFIDGKQVEEQYSRFGAKAVQTAAEIEYSSSLKDSGSADFHEFLKSEVGEETVKKVKERFEAVTKPTSAKYEELEAFAIRNDRVVFGIEKLELAAPRAEKFDALVRELAEKYAYSLSPSVVSEQKRRLVEEYTPELVAKLQTGNVVIHGGFSAAKSKDGHAVVLTFEHPLNKRFNLRRRLVFSFELPLKNVPEMWRARLETGASVPLGVFGALVPRFSDTEYRWDIVPLAVYLGKL